MLAPWAPNGTPRARSPYHKANESLATIDYKAVHQRILQLETLIARMIRIPSVLGESVVWDNFLKSIDSKMFKFCNAKSKLELTYALNEQDLGNDLYDILSELILDDPGISDEYDETYNHIDLGDFISFILTPFVAAMLIAEDRTMALAEAHGIRDESSELGNFMQPLDDHKEDVILFAQAPPRYLILCLTCIIERGKRRPDPCRKGGWVDDPDYFPHLTPSSKSDTLTESEAQAQAHQKDSFLDRLQRAPAQEEAQEAPLRIHGRKPQQNLLRHQVKVR
ncbi:hypothetical protein DFH06DRAFT_1139716 [Mycena polygramma]|nr:hypothetical protein DFH06DRAFT_1139716 [Mycena polygramma]